MKFKLLEAFADGMGAWKITWRDILEWPEAEMDDLLQWKYIASVVEKMNKKKEEADRSQQYAT